MFLLYLHSTPVKEVTSPRKERENQRSQQASIWSKINVIKQNDMYDVNRNQQVCTKSNFLSVWSGYTFPSQWVRERLWTRCLVKRVIRGPR